MKYVFIVGSKGFGNYGGYETFVEKLTEYHRDFKEIKYFIACKGNDNRTFCRHNATGFNIKVPDIGAAQAIYYDIKALFWTLEYIKKYHIERPVIYILACRIGPFMAYFEKRIHKAGGKIFINPDGHEWMRAKWSLPIKKYWKLSEKMMVKHSDLLICDSQNIETYILEEYQQFRPQTVFIAYGADITPSVLSDQDAQYLNWLEANGLCSREYYLTVGRFVPENNFETIIREFMKSRSRKKLAIIATENDTFFRELQQKLGFQKDPRIIFAGSVYDQNLLKKIRENAFGYLHGHEVGGTNPSLLEALGATELNLLLDVGFNREVAGSCAVYWNKEEGNLAALIDRTDQMNKDEKEKLGNKAKERIRTSYSWALISEKYEKIFLEDTV